MPEHRASTTMRAFLSVLTWAIATALVGPLCLFLMLVLAGPHSSMLPSAVQPAVVIAGWVAFILLPLFAARAAWRHGSKK